MPPIGSAPAGSLSPVSVRRSRLPVLSENGSRTRSVCVLLLGLVLVQADAALAQDSTPSEGASSEVLKACDLAAASPYDKQRPADVPGVTDGTNPRSALHGTLNPGEAVPACEAAVRAAPQDPRMLYQLARAYRDAKRFAEALATYQKAAQMGSALATFDLSEMYADGVGVPVDLKTQLYYLDEAARAGLSIAEDDYGVLYIKGNAVLPKDEKLGRQLISMAAQDGNPTAMNNMGFLLDEGLGGNKDEVEATSWYEKSAKAGNYKAMNSLGFRRLFGKAGKKDLVEARQWFEKSASGNDPNATVSLGGMFERGWGGPKDVDEARRLYRKAIALGEKDHAAKNLEKLDAGAGH